MSTATARRTPGAGTVPARMVGGPLSGQRGDVVNPPPQHLTFGAQSGFVYRLDSSAQGKGATYRYDRAATRSALRAIGLSEQQVSLATDNPEVARQVMARPEGVWPRGGDVAEGAEVDVRIVRTAEEWEVYAGGTLMDTRPLSDCDDGDTATLEQWAQEYGRARYDEVVAATEAGA